MCCGNLSLRFRYRQEFKGKSSEENGEFDETHLSFLVVGRCGGVRFCLVLMSIDCSFIGSCEGVITQVFLK